MIQMNPRNLIDLIRKECKQRENVANVEKYQRYFKTPFVSYGLTSPDVHQLVKMLAAMPEISLDTLLDAAPELISSLIYEETSVTMLLLEKMHKHYSRKTFESIEKWYDYGIDNWAEADIMGMMVIPLFLKKKIITYAELADWMTAGNKFRRRTVPVSLIKEIKLNKSTLDPRPYFNFLEPLVHDNDREVHQGMGWFLREAWKLRPVETEEFLMKHKQSAPRLMIRYACEKMTPEYRAKFRKEKTGN